MSPDLDRIAAVSQLCTEYGGLAFAWGRADCWTLASRASELLTGAPLVANWRGYKTPAGAMRSIKAHGASDVHGVLDGVLQRVPAGSHPRIGDIVAIRSEDPTWPALGVKVDFSAVIVPVNGFFGLDMMGHWTGEAWRLG